MAFNTMGAGGTVPHFFLKIACFTILDELIPDLIDQALHFERHIDPLLVCQFFSCEIVVEIA